MRCNSDVVVVPISRASFKSADFPINNRYPLANRACSHANVTGAAPSWTAMLWPLPGENNRGGFDRATVRRRVSLRRGFGPAD